MVYTTKELSSVTKRKIACQLNDRSVNVFTMYWRWYWRSHFMSTSMYVHVYVIVSIEWSSIWWDKAYTKWCCLACNVFRIFYIIHFKSNCLLFKQNTVIIFNEEKKESFHRHFSIIIFCTPFLYSIYVFSFKNDVLIMHIYTAQHVFGFVLCLWNNFVWIPGWIWKCRKSG